MSAIEQWCPIPGFLGYEASDEGRIRSTDRTVMRARYGSAFPVNRRGKILSLKTHPKTGYVSVELAGLDVLVHRAVLAAFRGPCPEGMEGAHGDGVRTHNALENLRYATRSENHADKVRHGTAVRGERVFGAKLTADIVRLVRRSSEASGLLAKRYGVSRTTIKYVRSGRTWGHI